MKGKKVWLILGAAALAGLVFSGCGNKTGAPAASDAAPAVSFPGGWKPIGDYSKKLNFDAMALQATEGYDFTAGDDMVKWYSDRFNYTLNITSVTFDNWGERVRLWVAAGELPDVAIIDYQHQDMAGWVEQDLLFKFPDNWKQKWPKVADAFSLTSLGPEMERRFGGVYFLPRPRFNLNLPGAPELIRQRGTLPNHLSFFYNKDWMAAVGLPVKTMYTVEEILEYGRRVKAQDPGKLGSKLIPITGRPEWLQRLFIESNNAFYNSFYKDKDGTYKWGPGADATLAGLKQYYQAYQEGILNSEFYTLKYNDDYNQFYTSGVTGGYFGEGTMYNMWVARMYWEDNQLPGDPETVVGVATVLGQDGLYHQRDLINYWQVIAFRPDIPQEKFERYMDVLEFNTTEAGYYQCNMGFEGIDWKRDENGDLVTLAETDEERANNKYQGMLSIPSYILPDDLSFDNPTVPKDIRELSWQLYKERCETSTIDTFVPIDWDLFSYDSPAMRRAFFMYDQEYANIITNSRSVSDVEKNWRAWVQDKMASAVKAALDELNTNLK
jgi:putative aldouronate transport system substrate-binding protein